MRFGSWFSRGILLSRFRIVEIAKTKREMHD